MSLDSNRQYRWMQLMVSPMTNLCTIMSFLAMIVLAAAQPAFAAWDLRSSLEMTDISQEPPELIEELLNLSERVVATAPHDASTVYIAIGASALPVAAGIEASLGAARVLRVPISGVGDVQLRDFGLPGGESFLWHYLDLFLKPLQARIDFNVVVFDYEASGVSMSKIRDLIKSYFARRGIAPTALNYVGYGIRKSLVELRRSITERIPISLDMERAFDHRHFDYLRTGPKIKLAFWLVWLNESLIEPKNVVEWLEQMRPSIVSPEKEAVYQSAVQFLARHAAANNSVQPANSCAKTLSPPD